MMPGATGERPLSARKPRRTAGRPWAIRSVLPTHRNGVRVKRVHLTARSLTNRLGPMAPFIIIAIR